MEWFKVEEDFSGFSVILDLSIESLGVCILEEFLVVFEELCLGFIVFIFI